MIRLLYFIIAAAAGFIFWKFVSGKQEGEEGRLHSLRFRFGRYTFWFHHWVYSAITSIIFLLAGVRNPIIHGLLIGGIVQGLTYKDFFYVFFETQKYPYRKL